MKIKYSKKSLRSNYILGIYFAIAGILITIAFILLDDSCKFELESVGIGLIAAGIFSLILHFYEKKKQYLTIENGYLIKNALFPKKIDLNEIQQIEKFAGNYILISKSTKLTIDTKIIDENSLIELNHELDKLNLE